MSSSGDLYATCAGYAPSLYSTWVAHSANGGSNWDGLHTFDTSGVNGGAKVIQVADGTIYAFWLQGNGTPITNVLRYAWLVGTNWSYSTNFGIILNSTNAGGSGNPLRFKGDNSNDFFVSNGAPQPAFANGRIYVAYADLPSTTSTTDRGDIFLAEATTNSNHWLGTPTVRKVNNDHTTTDQWDPSIAANPAGTELFIGYYSRQNDPSANKWIMAYGAKAYMTNNLANATFECIPISPTSFLPVFAGTVATSNNVWTFEPVWPPQGVCVDTNDVYQGAWDGTNVCPSGIFGPFPGGTDNNYVHFCADDYTWSASDSNYFYFAWCDRTRMYQNTRPDQDIKFAKIKQ